MARRTWHPSHTNTAPDSSYESGLSSDPLPNAQMFRSPSRGRPAEERGEAAAQQSYAEKYHTLTSGRGGAGNVRSPSCDPLERQKAQAIDKQEREIQAAALRSDEHVLHAVGRGGVGNVTRDTSADCRGRNNGGSVSLPTMKSAANLPYPHSNCSSPSSSSASLASPHPTHDQTIRSMSRSRSREACSASAQRGPAGLDKSLAAVDESFSVAASEKTATTGTGHGHGLLGKIASHIPGHHSNNS